MTLVKKIKGGTNSWRDKPENVYTIHRNLWIQSNPCKQPITLFHRTRTTTKIHDLYGNTRLRIVKTILRKQNGAGGINIPDFSLYYKATVIKIVWYWYKNRNIYQVKNIGGPELSPHTYRHLIFNKRGKNIQWRKDSLFNKWYWEN